MRCLTSPPLLEDPTTDMKLKRTVAIASAAALVVAVAPTVADASGGAVKTCARWNLDGGDSLLVTAGTWDEAAGAPAWPSGKDTSCRTARAVGDAYLKASGWKPGMLHAAGRTWRLRPGSYSHVNVDEFNYRTYQYTSRAPSGKWLSVGLEYDVKS